MPPDAWSDDFSDISSGRPLPRDHSPAGPAAMLARHESPPRPPAAPGPSADLTPTAAPAATSAATSAVSPRWYWNRLRCMSPMEIAHRLGRAVRIRAEAAGLFTQPAPPPPDLTAEAMPWISVPADIDPAPYLAAADRIVAGRFDIFARHDLELGNPPRWNRDPKTGIEAPLTFGKRLDYRDPRRVGDIKYLWEPNRHLHLVTLAQAWRLSGAAIYLDTLARHLDSWFAACPPGRGPNWSSALEPGLRLINWALTWQILGGAHSPLFTTARGTAEAADTHNRAGAAHAAGRPDTAGTPHGTNTAGSALRRRWLDSIHQHAEFIRGHFSRHSSANNHLLGEAAGLFIAGITWPHWPRAARWRQEAEHILEEEARRQNAPDGVNREQAVSYQQFVADLLLLPLLAARAHGEDFSPGYHANLERMLEFIASIMDAGGHLPMFGDADDGAVDRLDPRPATCRYRALLASGAVLFRRADFATKAGRLDDKTRWLFGPSAAARFRPGYGRLPVFREFPQGGYYILGSDFETPDEIRLIADAGPLGYRAIAAHGHADALSFTLSLGGEEFLIDPGTYAYHTEGGWRAYFRGTAAHNTLRVDGRDQSEPGGNFLWLTHARAGGKLQRAPDGTETFSGWHDGYRRLPNPVSHRRRIVFDPAQRRFRIEDAVDMQKSHEIELFFHFAEHCAVTLAGHTATARHAGRTLRLHLPNQPGARIDLLHGHLAPPAGWISRHFDERKPTTTLRWQARLTGNAVLVSEMEASWRPARGSDQ